MSRVREAMLAFQFLTIIPVKLRGELTAEDLRRSAAYFPVVGMVQGALAAVAAAALSALFSDDVTAGLLLALLIVFNGGFHLDGLADTFDGMAVKSTGDEGRDRERRLAVMKDSQTGAIGAIALVLAILLKFLLIHSLLLYASGVVRYSLLFLMPVFSKWVMVAVVSLGSPARKDGLGSMFIGSIGRKESVTAHLIVLGCSIVAAELFQHTLYAPVAAALFFALFIALGALCFVCVKLFTRRFGGLTGDHCGAAAELSDILYLMVVSIWLRHSIS